MQNSQQIFKLHSEYQPTGDQPQAIEKLVKGFQEGNQCETLLGVTGSGKTFTMAELMNDSGKIISCDIHPHRVELIKNGAKRLTLTNIQCVVNDASIYNNKIGTVDKVLSLIHI